MNLSLLGWQNDDFPPTLDLALSSISPEFSIGDPVLLIMEDSRHYSLGSSKHGSGTKADSDRELEIDAEWESLYPGESAGFVRLGPEMRFFGLSMYHQLHCLDSLRYAIQGREHVAKRSLMSGNNQSETEKGHDDGVYGVSSDDEYRGHEQKKMGRGTKRSQVHVSHAAHCLNYLRQTILCASDLTLEPELVLGSLDVGSGLGAMHICRDWSRVHDFVEQNSRDYKKHVDEENRHGGKGGGNRDL